MSQAQKKRNATSKTKADLEKIIKGLKKTIKEKDKQLRVMHDAIVDYEENQQKVERIIVSDEELIPHLQLDFLKKTAASRELTLEEVKKFDLLVKNKRLSQGESTINADYKQLPKQIRSDELLQIAGRKIGKEKP